MEPIQLRAPERLGRRRRQHPHDVATLVGHAHTAVRDDVRRPARARRRRSASTVTLDAEDVAQVWEAAPPSFALHLLHDDGRLTTHWRAL